MSKELAQTVGNKKVGLLIVLVAALAVLATLVSQWGGAKADLAVSPTITQAPSSGTLPQGSTVTYTATAPHLIGSGTGTLTINLPAGVTETTSTCTTTATAGTATNTSGTNSCAVGGTVTANGTVTLTVNTQVTATSGGVAGATASANNGSNTSTTAATGGFTAAQATLLTKTGSADSVPPGGGSVTDTITFTNQGAAATDLPVTLNDNITTAGVTVPAGTPANTGTGGGAFTCTSTNPGGWPGAAIVTTATTVLSCTTTTAVSNSQTAEMAITMTIPASATGSTTNDTASTGPVAIGGVTVTPPATDTVTVSQADLANVELRHVNEDGDVVDGQDVINNVRGARHNVCLFDATDPEDLAAFDLGTPLNLTNIQVNGGGGYKTVGDVTPSFTDPIFYTGTSGDSEGATCFSWTSTAAGDQEISVVVTVGATTATIDWDTNNDNNGNPGSSPTNADIIKEWNVLETSSVSNNGVPLVAVSGAGTNNVVYNITEALSLDPSTGNHFFNEAELTDAFLGSHITRTGATVNTTRIPLVGVNWTVSLTPGSCGVLEGDLSGTTTLNTDGSVGNQPDVLFFSGEGSEDCGIGDHAQIVFTGSEPGALGSGPGNTVTETVNFSFTFTNPVKQVLLAWAGQRVILEHDWRIPPGDSSLSDAVGFCPFDAGTEFEFAKAAEGPGNFVDFGNADTENDTQFVRLTNGNGNDTFGIADNSQENSQSDSNLNADAPEFPQDSCITRGLYESEDEGEVDIEVFADDLGLRPAQVQGQTVNATKVAFVIYYMKLNKVNVSLVNQVSKPTHNSSALPDYAPGNPWDATKDAANNTADWNVSRDLLVRGRVSGWFVNSNPSGRARDESDPQNILPADRWVMPDDWVNIAGGSLLAGSFRPSYDLMFSPAQAVPIALSSPNGLGINLVAVTGAGSTSSVLVVSSTAGLVEGSVVTVGTSTTSRTVHIVSANVITISPALTAAPAVGTPVFLVQGVPFEGPYSLVDIPGFASNNGGIAGAAISNIVPGSMRDTTQGDDVVDWWDAPMPPANINVSIRGTGFIKQVIKSDVYYLGGANSAALAAGGTQTYPNPYYYQNIPGSEYIPAQAAGGGYIWDSWGNDGPGGGGQGAYQFWVPAIIGTNEVGVGDATLSAANLAELAAIRTAYGDNTIARDLVVLSDNHGEFMVTANGDFKTDLTACASNSLAGGKLCKPGDKVGVGTVSAVADYPDFKKHFPIASNTATINWIWGGYKDVTVEPGETDQFKYVVFHGIDRDGFCDASGIAAVQLHAVLTSLDASSPVGGNPLIISHPGTAGNQVETVDFLIDSGEGIILNSNGGVGGGTINDGKQFATGVPTYDVAARKALGLQTFPLDSPVMPAGTTDECQAYIKVSNSLLGILNVLSVAHNDEGNIGFDKVIDLTGTTSYTLQFRWTLITWAGADNIPVGDALKGGASTANPGGNDISSQVTAVYGWNASSQTWLGYFPTGVNVPGANNLTALSTGQAYWIAITGPGSVTWTVTTNVGGS